MSGKTFLKLLLGIALFVFVIIALKWKTAESEVQVKYSQSSSVKTDIVETNTRNMTNVNAQTAGLMGESGQPNPSYNASSSSYSSSRNSSDDVDIPLIVTGTYAVKRGKYFAATERSVFESLLKYSKLTDSGKFDRLMNKSLNKGTCIYFEYGDKVILEELSGDNSAIRVSRFNESKSWWTSATAIQ